ncbi:endopeptidase La [Oecophyllibacter saccharovorans]|uniref:endopeptidase La n=1 Tax=Oecophyllibacter saccharovorans TaxID=2558360 RepID=UPI00116DAF30|nr:endopeptidase La [Oecophyllibacter saccharovorans]TPW34820.1 endopeptidase La [Oecophyllibacter saccharovorans]
MTKDIKPARTRRKTKTAKDAAKDMAMTEQKIVTSSPGTQASADTEKTMKTTPELRGIPVGASVEETGDQAALPVLPLRNIVVFPHMIVPLFVGREKSVHALENMTPENREIVLVAQKDIAQDEPGVDDIYRTGTVANVLQLLKLPDGTVKVLVEGIRRVRLTDLRDNGTCFTTTVEELADTSEGTPASHEALARSVLGRFEDYARLNKKIAPEILTSIGHLADDPSRLADTIASHLSLRIPEKQALLETTSVTARLESVFGYMEGEIEVLQVEKRIRGNVKKQMEKTQREYYLNEQMKAIQKELGDGEDGADDLVELGEKIETLKMPKEARDKARTELRKLKGMSPMSAESTVVRNYLDWLVGVPWNKRSRIQRSLEKAEAVLNADHYGLEKVKERILEYLAVQSRSRKLKGPILCLVGPPGVGKTSLARSIARATGRHYVRMSLGGMRDESEVRGHRRTYVGAMPGKIIQGMKKAEVSNPLFLLDEIEKVGSDWRGDPSSALLEVLDPEQNGTFSDHYLEVDYDLSDVMFITTANSLDMPQPLLDRMEIIQLSGYTEEEKVQIARRHLVAKQAANHNLRSGEWKVTDEALLELVRSYTREAGVRNLERMIARLARKAVREIVSGQTKKVIVTPENLEKYAGIPRFKHGMADQEDQIGTVTGLAWTQVGGEILTIETALVPGKGQIHQTGKLGDVMKESAAAAFSYVRAHASQLGIAAELLEKHDIHLHLPEGAVPKDGPSAGIGLTTALVSLLTQIPVRHDVAMTGEVTLRGRVLEIGGLKEKLLAALRAGITTVLIPKANEKDLVEIPDNVKQGLTIVPVSHVDEVLSLALTRPLEPALPGALLETAPAKARGVASQSLPH